MICATELLPHQVPAVAKLQALKVGALYMEMGTGKTRTALDLIATRLNAGKVDRVLWLCPYSVKLTIQREIEKHASDGLAVTRIEGIESLSNSVRLNRELLQYVQTYRVFLVVDESNLVKNHRAQRTAAIERLAGFCAYKLLLNGTPLSKSEKDLFAQWKILDWRILGYQSFWSFAANHLEYDKTIPGKIVRTLNVDYLVRKIAPYTYQVKKDECLTLPEKRYQTWYVALTNDQRGEYERVKDEFLMQLVECDPTTLYRLFTALQHVVSGRVITSPYRKAISTNALFETPDENPRIQALCDIVARCDDKMIVWCKYSQEIRDVAEVLRRDYGTDAVVEFYGEVSKRDRKQAIDRFASDARFFVANKTCAGYGLNLQQCHAMVYYSNDWDWATRSQSEDRVHRIGQTQDVLIIDICAERTIDERILKCLARKERLVDAFKAEIAKQKDKKALSRWIDNGGVQLVRGKAAKAFIQKEEMV